MTHRFLERLAQGPLLADGAMGTMLYANGVPYERCFDELNLSEPDLVQRIHREYIAAGAGLIETNTFGANRIRLSTYGLEGRVRDINYRGVRIAREAREIAGESVFVAGAAIQYLRDMLGIVRKAAETERLARSVSSSGGVFEVYKDGQKIFSKAETGRFPEHAEIDRHLG